MSKNITTVQNIYAAFGRGDVPAILEHISDDCVWEYGPGTSDVPWLQPRKGRAGVAEFFRIAGTELAFKSFAPTTIVGDDKVVIALATLEATVVRTGKTIHEVDEAHIWHFDDKGRVVKFRHAADTLQQQRAVQP
jgi:ketosteroid isomerase-like protein